ncbi:MAG: F0F1 ATP synthase subunit delta [Candidatus Aceula meridiana]|nr:F0F1 ATP synthase subunit delta [Candidatus Aceula meridiana]
MGGMLILQFLILTFVVSGVIIFFLHRFLISSTQGAVNRLNTETEGARAKQADLNQKIKEANEELEKRKKEAEELVKKMMEDAEEAAKGERSKVIEKSRKEAEEIITKAHRTRDAVREEIEKELSIKLVGQASEILKAVLGDRSSGAFSDRLIDEFLEKLKDVDPSQISDMVKVVDVVTVSEMSADNRTKIEKLIKDKLNREITFNYQNDPKITGGALLKFGSLVLDGSLHNAIAEKTVELKEDLEKG